jgi:aspartyl/asparaginyl beta-hydroxylase (cupin superfamily)
MFLEPFDKLNHGVILTNYNIFYKDYCWGLDNNYFIDYNSMDHSRDTPTKTGYFWQAFPLVYNKKPWPHKNVDISKLKSLEVIQQLSIQPILATFSLLLPNSDIANHEDHDEDCIAGQPDTSVIKYHYGISSYGDCGLRVGNAIESVENGKLNIFDESMTHSAYNYSTVKRGVLILSFLKSDLIPSTVGV